MRNKRRTTTRRRVMYGGAPNPAPVSMFPGQNYNRQDVYNALNNYLQAAYSINQAALAIQETSSYQNNSTDGTRNLQKTSASSFSTAASSFVSSLRSIYGSLTGETIVLPPAETPSVPSIPSSSTPANVLAPAPRPAGL